MDNVGGQKIVVEKMLPFVENYTDLLNSVLNRYFPGMSLSRT